MTLRIFLVALCLALTGCGNPAALAQGATTALSVVDAIARAVPKVVSTCEEAGADVERVKIAKEAIKNGDYATAIVVARELLESVRKQGVEIPEDVDEKLSLAEGAMAAGAIERFAKKISTPSTSAPTPAPAPTAAPEAPVPTS